MTKFYKRHKNDEDDDHDRDTFTQVRFGIEMWTDIE
jgi:hypothetical protein